MTSRGIHLNRGCDYGNRNVSEDAQHLVLVGFGIENLSLAYRRMQLSFVNVAATPHSAQNNGMAQPAFRIAATLILTSIATASQPLSPTSPVLHDATPIRLRLTRDLTFNNVKPGDLVDFEVLEDLRIDGLLVLAHGVRATATITQAEPNTRKTHGGKLGVNLESIPLLNGGKVAIRAMKEGREAANTDQKAGAPMANAALVRPAAPYLLFAYGRDEVFPEGTGLAVYIDGELKLDPAGFLEDIAFTSNPPGALVSIYGTPVGRTPFTTKLAPGTYKAVFSADGYPDLTESMPVGPGYSNTVHAAFESKPQ
jgi:hypothetical protein